MRHLRTMVVALLLACVGSLAQAFEFPPDAEFIVTDANGVIVGLGRSVGGTAVAMEVWRGFEGPAQLTLFLPDGTTRAIAVAIEAGVVAVEGVDLRELLARVFQDVALRFVATPGGAPNGAFQGIGPDGDPPGQDRRPEDPPGQDRRPEEPPGQDRRPQDPPGQDRRP